MYAAVRPVSGSIMQWQQTRRNNGWFEVSAVAAGRALARRK